MEQYISQLIEDILSACRNSSDFLQASGISIEDHIAEVERYSSGEGEQKISDFSGLEAVQFPPKQRLSENQIRSVVDAYEELLFSWNIKIYFPEELPIDLKYDLLVSTLDREVFITNDEYSYVEIELCTYNIDICPFGEYCSCKADLKLDEDRVIHDSEISDEELPF